MIPRAGSDGPGVEDHTEPLHNRAGEKEDSTPLPEAGPPYSHDFLAHLHGGVYEDLPEHDELWRSAQAHPDAVRVLTALDTVTAQLRTLKEDLQQ